MKKKEALAIVGGLSKPGKMPCYGYSLPTSVCNVGGKLAGIEGSVCAGCYANKGNYRFGNVQNALHRRFESLHNPQWVEAMTTLIKGYEYFRWHDSGDITSVPHMRLIARVCENTPETLHWLPTRERSLLRQYATQYGALPDNLVVRVSDAMVDRPQRGQGYLTSGVHQHSEPVGFVCEASLPSNPTKCGTCRACWDKSVSRISYFKH